MNKPGFLHVDTNSHKLKVLQKYFGWAWSKIGVANLKWIDILHAGSNSGKLKVISVVLSLGWTKMDVTI